MILGADSPAIIAGLIRKSELHLAVVDKDAAKVARMRKHFMAAGQYGDRVSVHHIVGERLPFTDGFANLVIASGSNWPDAETKRMAAPYHGVAWLSDTQLWKRGPVEGGGRWTHMYADLANSAFGVVISNGTVFRTTKVTNDLYAWCVR